MRSLRSILLTGGAGFIGSTLARHLLETEGLERLIVLDKLTEAGRRDHLSGPDQDPRFEFVEGDIADRPFTTELLKYHGTTGVFNLAAASPLNHSPENADEFIATNIVGTMNLMEACRHTGIPLLHCSTDEVYGPIAPPAKLTENLPLSPPSPYAASKASADLLCQAATRTHQQDVLVTRCSNNYGPRQHPEKLIPTIIRHALLDEPIPLDGDGMQIRDWIHVNDHCRGMIAAFLRGKAGEIYNFGGHCERTNLGVARDVLKALGKPESLISSSPHGLGPNQRYAVDTTKALGKLGWNPLLKMQASLPAIVRELASGMAR